MSEFTAIEKAVLKSVAEQEPINITALEGRPGSLMEALITLVELGYVEQVNSKNDVPASYRMTGSGATAYHKHCVDPVKAAADEARNATSEHMDTQPNQHDFVKDADRHRRSIFDGRVIAIKSDTFSALDTDELMRQLEQHSNTAMIYLEDGAPMTAADRYMRCAIIAAELAMRRAKAMDDDG